MQWTLFLVVVMGQCSFSTCSLYQYHFIRENKTWDEAQKYCRENYTDLATVSDMTDTKRLWSSTENQDEAWIGLHSYPGKDTRTWYWSLPGLEFNDSDTRWKPRQPDDNGQYALPGKLQNCATIDKQLWNDAYCQITLPFFCYSETEQSNNTFHYIEKWMTWPQAQSYCRQHYTDLVSGLDQLHDPTVASQSSVWIGLFRDTWRWSDGSNSSFRNWESLGDLVDGQSNKTCATVLNTAGTWSYDYCSTEKPFYCYGAATWSYDYCDEQKSFSCYEESAPRRKYVVRVKLAADPSVTMTDPAVTESMLKQMEAAFRDKGLSVKLSWRKLPDKLNTTKEESQQDCAP